MKQHIIFFFLSFSVIFYLSCGGKGKKECSALDSATCEAATDKVCRLINNTCTEIKNCAELTTLGQPGCKRNVLAQEKCQWSAGKCEVEPQFLSDFRSSDRAFKDNKKPDETKTREIFSIIGVVDFLKLDGIKFAFLAEKDEAEFSVSETGVWKTPYKFTYRARELDPDLMLIELKGTAPKTGSVGGVANVNVVEPFERAKLLYQKSKNELYFLIVPDQADMSKFSAISKPADFIFIGSITPTLLKGKLFDLHAAYILKP